MGGKITITITIKSKSKMKIQAESDQRSESVNAFNQTRSLKPVHLNGGTNDVMA